MLKLLKASPEKSDHQVAKLTGASPPGTDWRRADGFHID
jgi:hypothetical protein